MDEQSKEISVFKFQENDLRATMIDGEPWFVGKDACQMLDIKNVSDAIVKLDADEKDVIALTDTIGRQQSTLVVSLPGLQKLIFRSDKPEANKITRWVTHEVLPSIYKTGSYSTQNTTQQGNSLIYHYSISGTTPEDIKRDQAILAFLQQAETLLRGKHATRKEKASSSSPSLITPVKKSLEEKILEYIATHQHTQDRDQLPTARNLSRYIKDFSPDQIKASVQGLLDQEKIEIFKNGKASCYRLKA